MTGFQLAQPYKTGGSALGTMQDIEQTRQLQQRTTLGDLQMQMEQLKAARAAEQYKIQQAMLAGMTPDQRLAFSYAPEQAGQQLAKQLYPELKPTNVTKGGALVDPGTGRVIYQAPDAEGVQWQGAPGDNLANARPPTTPQPQSTQTFAPGASGAPTPLTGQRPPAAEVPPVYRDLVNAHATRNNIPVEIFGNLIKQESNFNPNAVSGMGAAGLTQIMPKTAGNPGFNVTPMRDNTPAEQIRFGADYLGALVQYYRAKGKDPESALNIALGAYNWGVGNTDKWLAEGGDLSKVPPETLGFVQKIIGPMQGGGGATPQPNGQATPQPNGQATPTPAPAQTADAGGWETATKGGLPANTGAKPGQYWQRRKTGTDANGKPTYEYRTAPGGEGGGPFGSNAIDANAYNILLTGDPGTQEYALAYYHATQPKYIQVADPDDPSRLITKAVTPELPPNIRRPTWTPPPQVAPDGSAVASPPAPAVSTPPATASAIPGTEKGGGPNANERKALKDAEVEAARVKDAIKTYRTAIDETGGPGFTSWAGLPTEDATRLNTAYNNVALLAKGDVLYQLGVLNGPDLDIIRRTLLDPSTLKAWAADPKVMKDQLQQIEDLIDKGLAAKRQQFGGGAKDGGAGDFAGMSAQDLLAIDPAGLNPDQKAAYLAALRAAQ